MKPWRSKKYLREVAELGCHICRNTETCVAHHEVGRGWSGMATKAPDYRTMPLCHLHHMELHNYGWATFEEKHNVTQPDMVGWTQIELAHLLPEDYE